MFAFHLFPFNDQVSVCSDSAVRPGSARCERLLSHRFIGWGHFPGAAFRFFLGHVKFCKARALTRWWTIAVAFVLQDDRVWFSTNRGRA